ncbi:isoprenylcysteine carboxylmethyltransferase family protein [Rubrobacter tropicus]|uniref:Isoprenylcysteine carboxylmethyltransferase family protein n=1 Tax=Rubrobacter tropicus TaxID=2653851 RepID=A0A6G8Q5S0_9ACTN|nr:isoprenylcysteine carboxylmethyltransferase family protein [Rubrobacter tropicus]QIN81821.1 isoprenylcysteine carboxylmethyltransferase family protein [Rubrobacter tropicus]
MGDGNGERADNPGVVAPPPLIFAGGLAAGLLTNRLRPTPFLPRGLSRALGWPLVVAGLALGLWGFREMRRAGTNVDPYHPTTAIVDRGPYGFTRNPLYVGMTLIYSGLSARANALPAALLLPAVLHVVDRGVVKREERYLEGKFGDEYLRYKGRVRRWI